MSKPLLLKPEILQSWRRDLDADFAIGPEAAFQLDEMLRALDWKKLLPFEFPLNDYALITKSFVHKTLKDDYQVSSGQLKDRVVQNLSFLALHTLKSAGDYVTSLNHSRIMPEHIDMIWTMISVIINNAEWKGWEIKPKSKKRAKIEVVQ